MKVMKFLAWLHFKPRCQCIYVIESSPSMLSAGNVSFPVSNKYQSSSCQICPKGINFLYLTYIIHMRSGIIQFLTLLLLLITFCRPVTWHGMALKICTQTWLNNKHTDLWQTLGEVWALFLMSLSSHCSPLVLGSREARISPQTVAELHLWLIFFVSFLCNMFFKQWQILCDAIMANMFFRTSHGASLLQSVMRWCCVVRITLMTDSLYSMYRSVKAFYII